MASKKASSIEQGGASNALKYTLFETPAPGELKKPRIPASAYYIFVDYFTQKKYPVKKPPIAAMFKAAREAWDFLPDEHKAPFTLEAARRTAIYEKEKEAYEKKKSGQYDASDKFHAMSLSDEVKAQPFQADIPIDVSGEESEGYVFLSAFGIFMEDFDVTKDSLDEYLDNWASMSESDKSLFVSMAAARMAEHEELTVAYVTSAVDSLPIGFHEDHDREYSSESDDGCEASSAFLIFFNEFADNYKKIDETPFAVAVAKMKQDWDELSESEKKPYHERAQKLMEEYDASVLSLFQG